MPKLLSIYIIFYMALIILAVVSILFIDKRYRKNHGRNIPAGFEKTEEIIIDPKNGKRLRVYFNPGTGDRFYHEKE